MDVPVTSLEDDIERSMKEHLPDGKFNSTKLLKGSEVGHESQVKNSLFSVLETNENKTIREWNLGNRSIFGASIKETMVDSEKFCISLSQFIVLFPKYYSISLFFLIIPDTM